MQSTASHAARSAGRPFGPAAGRAMGDCANIVKSLQAKSRLQERGTRSIASIADRAQRPAIRERAVNKKQTGGSAHEEEAE